MRLSASTAHSRRKLALVHEVLRDLLELCCYVTVDVSANSEDVFEDAEVQQLPSVLHQHSFRGLLLFRPSCQTFCPQGHVAAKPALERALTQAQETLHPMHAIVVDCLMPLVNCSRATQDLPAAIRYLQQLLAALEVIIGCHSVEV